MIKDGADAAVPYFALQAHPLIEAGRLPQEADFALAREWLSPELLPFFEEQHARMRIFRQAGCEDATG